MLICIRKKKEEKNMKQIELTKEEKEKLSCINTMVELATEYGMFDGKEVKKEFIKELKEKLNVRNNYPTIREYLNENNCGAYYEFSFNLVVGNQTIKINNICCCEDFERIYNGALLDKYYVTEVKTRSEGCGENYTCYFNLTVVEKED